jgi:hypothetical protein
MADSTAMTRHEHKVTFPVGDVPKDAAWYDTTRRVFFDEYHIELTPQECLRRQACTQEQQEAGEEFGVWKEAQQAALGCASAARAHPRGAADELLGAEAPQQRIYQRGW